MEGSTCGPRKRHRDRPSTVRRIAVVVAAALVLTWSTSPSGTAQDASANAVGGVVGEVRYLARDQRSAWTGRAPLAVEVFAVDVGDLADARAVASVRVADLRSGNALRDFNARATVFESGDHPEVRFRLRRVSGDIDPDHRGPQALELIGDLTLRDVTREVRATASVLLGDQRAEVEVRFEVSLAAYGVSAPRFLTLVVEDAVAIEVDASWPLDRDSTTTTR
jgi:polyisoprenoid-binding protein YceI